MRYKTRFSNSFKNIDTTPNPKMLQNLMNFEKPPKILQKTKLRLEKNGMHD